MDNQQGTNDAKVESYWFKIPDILPTLVTLRHAEIKCYLVVLRAIQKDRNAGRISERQVSERSGVTYRHVHEALVRLVRLGLLRRNGKPGVTALYSLPHSWSAGKRFPVGNQSGTNLEANCFHPGNQLERSDAFVGNQHRFPRRDQHRFPAGNQHLESLENTESSSSPVENGHLEYPPDVAPDEPAATAAIGPLKTKPSQERASWITEEIKQVREALRQHFREFGATIDARAKSRVLPDIDLTTKVLSWMHDLEDVRQWLWDMTSRGVRPQTWGFYLWDAQRWPSRRNDVIQQLEAQRRLNDQLSQSEEADTAAEGEGKAALEEYEQMQRERVEFIEAAKAKGWPRLHPDSLCRDCFGFGRCDIRTDEICEKCEAGRQVLAQLRAAERCDVCKNFGYVQNAEGPKLYAWCVCIHAERKREQEPDLVDEANKTLVEMLAPTTPPSKLKPAGRNNLPAPIRRTGGPGPVRLIAGATRVIA